MTRSAHFWNRIADRYSRKPVADQSAYERKLEVTASYLSESSEVLEIGCGTGSTALVHAPRVKHIRAVDFSERMIAIAEHKRTAAGVENVTFECATIDDLDSAQRKYDAILALSVLHLCENWTDVIDKMKHMLRPGGVFVSSTACIGDSMAWLRFVLPLGQALRVLPTLAIFTTAELEGALAGAGFGIEHAWHPGKSRGVFIVARRPAADEQP